MIVHVQKYAGFWRELKRLCFKNGSLIQSGIAYQFEAENVSSSQDQNNLQETKQILLLLASFSVHLTYNDLTATELSTRWSRIWIPQRVEIFCSPPSSRPALRPLKLLTYSQSWALLEEPPIVQPLKNFPAFYGTRRFNTVFTPSTGPHPEPYPSNPLHPILSR
jgi:hypothetical protein